MIRNRNKETRIHQALFDFSVWYEEGMQDGMANCLTLKKVASNRLTNPVLLFLVPRAIDGFVATLVLEVLQAYEMMDVELRRLKLRRMERANKDYRHLKKIRNKLVGHKIENLVKTRRHSSWYQKTYGTYEAIFELINRIAERVDRKVSYLIAKDLLKVSSGSSKSVERFEDTDVNRVIAAVQGAGK